MFPTRVLVAVDGSEVAEHAAREASRLCVRTDSELHVMHVAPPPNVWAGAESFAWQADTQAYASEIKLHSEAEGRKLLEEQVEKIGKIGGSGVEVAGSHLRFGRADAIIVDLAEELRAGLVVVGSRGLGAFGRTLMGSVSDSLIHHAHCSVLVMRGDESDLGLGLFTGRILAGYDGSEVAEQAVRAGAELATALNSELHVAAVTNMSKVMPYAHPYTQADWDKDIHQAQEETARTLEEMLTRLGEHPESLQITSHLSSGQPAVELVSLAEQLNVGVTLVGSRGRGGIRRALLGSVSTSVTHHALGSVLVFRSSAHSTVHEG